MRFADVHNHLLCGVDDGPASEQEMLQMLRMAYDDGIRVLCLTPHFHPGYFGDNRAKAAAAFEKLRLLAAEKYPELKLFLGNELRYGKGCTAWLEEGLCRTINDSDYVLVDFASSEKASRIIHGLERIMGAGYIPVLAHAERYRELSIAAIADLSGNGVWIQIDEQSLFGGYGFGAKRRARALLKGGIADLISTDAHDLKKRTPKLSRGYRYAEKKYGKAYADALCFDNAMRLLRGDSQEGNDER